jgi:hypothetical protein
MDRLQYSAGVQDGSYSFTYPNERAPSRTRDAEICAAISSTQEGGDPAHLIAREHGSLVMARATSLAAGPRILPGTLKLGRGKVG